MGKKHGKRVSIDKNLNLESGTDVFSNPELLDAYLDSLGVGHAQNLISTTETREISDRLFGGNSQEEYYEDCEDAGKAIADMLMQKMGGSPRPTRHEKQVKKQSVTVTTEVATKTEVEVTPESESENSQKVVEVKEKKLRSNICLIKYVNGVKHISVRDFAGNSTSTVVRSGEMYIKPEDVDACLRELYIYRKLTGSPIAVYDESEFVDRMLMKRIYEVSEQYIFAKSENFEDVILVFKIDEDEMDQFVKYVKGGLTEEEIPDTILALVSTMSTTSVLTGDLGMANWYLATYAAENSMKDYLESDILEHVEQIDDTQVHIDFSNYDEFLNAIFRTIGGYVESIENVKKREQEEIMPGKTAADFERFDPYKNQSPSTEERKETGASSDVKTFPGENDESESRSISGNDHTPSPELHNVGEGSEGINQDVRQNTQIRNSEEEKEAGVRTDWGDRGSSELKESQKEEVQTGVRHTEIAEVNPETFRFEEEKEEKHSMVVDRIVCGKK